jgi:alginate O-acetyltransferase complex protein AlgI
MLFNSFDFVLFLPAVFLLYWLAGNLRLQNALLVVASYVFYGWWDWRFLGLIFFSSLVDFLVGRGLGRTDVPRHRKALLWTSVGVNLGLLGFFKYYNFFLDSFAGAFSFFGYTLQARGLDIVLPVGISFYTFQTLSYSIDVYRRRLEPTRDAVAFFAFVSFFPQLVAGPIERASHLLPQFAAPRRFLYKNVAAGAKLVLWGFFLKLVVADRAALYVNAIYNHVPQHDGLSFMAATVLFAFQIYGDFAGYSLIAIGTARFFDIDIMTNFNRPYFAASIREFWSRWHISLSTWFRDYLYIPLGGNRVARPRWLFNLFVTFLVSGLWHGASWTFVAWGALNGLYMIAEALFFRKIPRLLSIAFTFVLVNIAWVFFRADTLPEAFHILRTMALHPGRLYIGTGDDVTAPAYAALAVALLLFVEVRREFFAGRFRITQHPNAFVRLGAYALLAFVILYIGVFGESQFIYFQF